MMESYLDNKARFRLLITQLELARERAEKAEAAAAAAGAAAYAPHADPERGHPLLDSFILEMLYEILARNRESVHHYFWRIDAIDPPELRERILRESDSRPYIVLYADAEDLHYSFADEPPGGNDQ